MYTGDLRILHLLLDHDADIEAANEQGQFPLSIAVHRCDLSCIDHLVSAKADIDRDCSASGASALHVSVLRNAVDVVYELLELKANPVRGSRCPPCFRQNVSLCSMPLKVLWRTCQRFVVVVVVVAAAAVVVHNYDDD